MRTVLERKFPPPGGWKAPSNEMSIIALVASSRSYVRYLGEHHLMPFLFVKAMFVARWRTAKREI
jgi:hypothetical protein